MVNYNGGYVNGFDLEEQALQLQNQAMTAKLGGDHKLAVALYRELLGMVRALEETDAFALPEGMPAQLVLRAIELEEKHIAA